MRSTPSSGRTVGNVATIARRSDAASSASKRLTSATFCWNSRPVRPTSVTCCALFDAAALPAFQSSTPPEGPLCARQSDQAPRCRGKGTCTCGTPGSRRLTGPEKGWSQTPATSRSVEISTQTLRRTDVAEGVERLGQREGLACERDPGDLEERKGGRQASVGLGDGRWRGVVRGRLVWRLRARR